MLIFGAKLLKFFPFQFKNNSFYNNDLFYFCESHLFLGFIYKKIQINITLI